MKKNIVVLVLLSFLVSSQVLYANTWQAEVRGASKKLVMDVITADFVEMGYSVLSSSDYQLVFGRDADDTTSMIWFGSRFNGTPQYRASFSFAQLKNTTKINMIMQMVTNPGSAFEKYMPIDHPIWWTYIGGLNARFHGYAGYGFSYYQTGRNYEMGYIYKNSSAFENGVKPLDRIIKINGKKVNGMKREEFDSYLNGEVGSTVDFTLKYRKEPERDVTLTKSFIKPEFKPDLIKDEEQATKIISKDENSSTISP